MGTVPSTIQLLKNNVFPKYSSTVENLDQGGWKSIDPDKRIIAQKLSDFFPI